MVELDRGLPPDDVAYHKMAVPEGVKPATVDEEDEQNVWEVLPDGAAGLTRNVLVPVLDDPVTTSVIPVPAIVGVTLIPESTPPVNADEVPVIPAVPLKATVLTKLFTALLLRSWAVRVIPVIAVPAVWGEEIAEMAK